MREIVAHVIFVVGVGEIVDPARGVGIDIDDARVDEVVQAAQRAGNGFVDDASAGIDISGIFRDENHFGGIGRAVGVEAPFGGIEAIGTFGSFGCVEPFIAEVHLPGVEHLLSGDGMGGIYAVDGGLLFFRVARPGDRNFPVEMRGDGIAVFILRDLIDIIAAVRRVGEPFADDGVAHPIDELLVLRVGDFGFVHPEVVDRNPFGGDRKPPERIDIGGAHAIGAARDQRHVVRRRLVPYLAGGNTGQFASRSADDTPPAAREKRCGQYDRNNYLSHISFLISELAN